MAAKEEFNITQEEADKLKKALKNEEFRKLLADYAEEISDPENKKKYEEELTQLEKERGVDVKFVNPKPGFVLKSFILPEGEKKAFINICHSDVVDKATSARIKGDTRERWSIPLTMSPPREDLDKSGNKCSVFDAVFHTETYQKGQLNPRFKQMLIATVFDTIENQMKTKLDRSKVVYLRMPFKGVPTSTVIRKKTKTPEGSPDGPDLGIPLKVPYPPLNEEKNEAKPAKKHRKKKHKKKEKQPCEPEYSVVHRGGFSMQDFTNERESTRIKRPEQLLVTVKLPGVESAGTVDLDIFEKRLLLECSKPLYKLDLALPYPIDEDNGSAKFNKSKQELVITLPVLPQQQPLPDLPSPKTPLITEIEPTTETQGTEPLEHSSNTELAESVMEASNGDQLSKDQEQVSVKEQTATPQLLTSTKGAKEWSSKGDWTCPPFSYRQDEVNVCYVLHTPCVKNSSLVSYIDEHYAQLTYKTESGENYSFYVTFPDGFSLDADDCSIDISPENIVLLLKKSIPESSSAPSWEKFTVGLNPSQTTEKLFLTATNVQSAIEHLDSLPDPWTQKKAWTDSTEVKVKSVSEENLVVEITDSSKTESHSTMDKNTCTEGGDKYTATEDGDKNTATEDGDKELSSVQAVETATNGSLSVEKTADDNPDPLSTKEEFKDYTPGTFQNGHDDSKHCSPLSDKTKAESLDPLLDGKQTETEAGPSGEANVVVEKDGSVFIRADDEYLRRRYEANKSEGEESTQENDSTAEAKVTKSGIQLSNQLIYSLD